MRTFFALAICAASIFFSGPARAIYISDDRGGRIGDYLDRYSWLRQSSETVEIDGPCLSACTLITGMVPKNRICVTARAELGFHRAYDIDWSTRTVRGNRIATQMMYASYSRDVQRWVSRHGGLTPRLKVLRGAELQRIYRPCP